METCIFLSSSSENVRDFNQVLVPRVEYLRALVHETLRMCMCACMYSWACPHEEVHSIALLFFYTSWYPTDIASAALQRTTRGQPSHGGWLTLGQWVAQTWAARWASGGWPPLSLLFYPLTCLWAFSLSTSLVLASNSRPDVSTLPTVVAQSRLPP